MQTASTVGCLLLFVVVAVVVVVIAVAAVSLALPRAFKREIEKKERARGQERM